MSTKVPSSAVAGREKCLRNKRKFRQDPPSTNDGCGDDNDGSASSVEEENSISEARSPCGAGKGSCGEFVQKDSSSSSCSASGFGKSEAGRVFEHIKIMKWIRNGQAKASGDGQGQGVENLREEESSNLDEVEWDDCTEEELEELLVKSLGSLYNTAISKIEAKGNSAEEALRAVLRHGRCDGAEDDAVSNIVENSLAYLSNTESHVSEDTGENSFADLKELQRYSLAEMVGSLRKVRPMLSKFEAMWDLLMYDMNVPACDVDEDSAISSSNKEPIQGQSASNFGNGKGGSVAPSSLQEDPVSTGSSSDVSKENWAADHRPIDAMKGGSKAPLEGSNSTVSSSCASVVTRGEDHQPGGAQKADTGSLTSSENGPDTLDSTSASAGVIQAGAVLEPSSPLSNRVSTSQSLSKKSCLSPSISPAVSSVSELTSCPKTASPASEVALLSSSDCTPHSHARGVAVEGSSDSGVGNVDEPSASPNAACAVALSSHSPEKKQPEVFEDGTGAPAPPIENLKDDKSDTRQGGRNTEEFGGTAGATSDSSSKPAHPALHDVGGSEETSRDQKADCSEDCSEVQPCTSLPASVDEKRHEECGPLVEINSVASESAPNAQIFPHSESSQGDGSSRVTQNRQACCDCGKDRNVNKNGCAESASPGARRETVPDDSATFGDKKRECSVIAACGGENSSTKDESCNSLLQAAKLVKMDPECLSLEASATAKGPKDEVLVLGMLVQRTKELETQLQERTEWAKQKVMQAARRLSKDLHELKALRLEKEEWLQQKKERKAFEDTASEKVTKLENDLRKTTGKVDSANVSIHRAEAKNKEIRAEMEAAKLSASEVQAYCNELAKKEKKYIKKEQAWEKQKAKFQEEISEEKRTLAALQKQLVLAKEQQQQAEVRWRQEEKAREDATLRADHEKRTREQSEAATKKREEALRRKAESTYQRHREEVQRLEGEIAQLRASTDAAQLATSRWGPGVAVTSNMRELGTLQALKESNNRLSRELSDLQHSRWRDVRRERECVMCMCEEMSVVFLPCAHLVICVKCNELHQKQGMRDCPSCRTVITQRIRVFGVSTQ